MASPKTVVRASLRTAGLDYAKRTVKAPAVVAGPKLKDLQVPSSQDYAKMSPYSIGSNDGPLTLNNMGRPKKVNTKVNW